jgi:DNA polymerase/3'-5' exonuclease PolX|tara:strand:+ start:1753 stop:2748 length:996 start_codon:yes stop_codon:yes gene_type:complete
MNSRSITDYILKLEKENSELRKVRAVLGDIDSIEVCRTKIEQLKKLFHEASEEKVKALTELNDLKYMMRTSPSYTDTTARVTKKSLNDGLVQRLLELGNMTSDFYKSMTYQKAADAVANLPYEVQTGESLMNLPGIGKGIAAKVDEYLDEQDSDYEESECSDSESIASNDEGSFVSETDDEEYFVSHNAGLSEMIYEYADRAEDNFKRNAYTKAGDTIYNLSYKITSGKDAMKLRGIGKSIAKKIDDYLNTKKASSMNEKLATCFLKLGNLEEPVYKSEAYWNAAEKIRDLTYEVTNGNDVRHLRGFGPSICDKIDEYINTGRMLRLEELS